MTSRLGRGRASLTAMAVSAARGLSGVDPLATRVLPLPVSVALRAAKHLPGASTVGDLGSLGLVSHLKWRTRAIDDDVATSEFTQMLLLGAGLCTRAHRLSLPGVTVFEVDHPATQQRKRSAMELARHRARDVRYVSVDFGRQDLVSALNDAGFDRDAKTYVVWEGVVMYLPTSATQSSLRALRALCAPGSRLAVSYMSDRVPSAVVSRLANVAFASIGEPLRASYSVQEMDALLAAADFETRRGDSGRLGFFASERLAFAERR